jgi:hypothetical protein
VIGVSCSIQVELTESVLLDIVPLVQKEKEAVLLYNVCRYHAHPKHAQGTHHVLEERCLK